MRQTEEDDILELDEIRDFPTHMHRSRALLSKSERLIQRLCRHVGRQCRKFELSNTLKSGMRRDGIDRGAQ